VVTEVWPAGYVFNTCGGIKYIPPPAGVGYGLHLKLREQAVMKSQATNGYGSDAAVAAFFGVHIKTLPRWDARPDLGFPPPIRVNGRRYREWAAVHEFARRSAVAHAGQANT
jgi:hypothetical protein